MLDFHLSQRRVQILPPLKKVSFNTTIKPLRKLTERMCPVLTDGSLYEIIASVVTVQHFRCVVKSWEDQRQNACM